jgi:hypothetical protein
MSTCFDSDTSWTAITPQPGLPSRPRWYTRKRVLLLITAVLSWVIGFAMAPNAASGRTSNVVMPAADNVEATAPVEAAGEVVAAQASPGSALSGQVSCQDSMNDGQPLDIVSVTLTGQGDWLVVRFDTTEPPPLTGTVLWTVFASSVDGNESKQLGVKYLDGSQIAYFVYDFGTAQQENLFGTVDVDGSSMTASFPASMLADLGPSWRWSATTNVEGTDTDTCPDAGADWLDPEKLTFPM